jgi:hypothetical protein
MHQQANPVVAVAVEATAAGGAVWGMGVALGVGMPGAVGAVVVARGAVARGAAMAHPPVGLVGLRGMAVILQ